MIQDILVNLSTTAGPKDDPTRTYAISLAQQFNARLTGVAVAYQVYAPGPMFAPAIDIVDAANKENEERALSAIERFDSAARLQSIQSEARKTSAMPTHAASLFGRQARCFDLSVVSQPEPDGLSSDELFFEAALFDSGRPVILVPYIHTGPVRLKNIICCWDGSREAARSIGDAMDFLSKADTVSLFTVQSNGTSDPQREFDMPQHLARRKATSNSPSRRRAIEGNEE